jgi:thioesterase domain-containing protein
VRSDFNNYISDIYAKGISLTLNKGKIAFSGPEEYITEQFIESLKENKGRLVKHLWPSDVNIMPIRTEGSKPPLVLVHGELLNYFLHESLGNDQPLYGFFHLGSDGEKIHCKSVFDYCKDYIEKLERVISSKTVCLGGFSFGAIVAFEMAIQLQKKGYHVPFVALVDILNPEKRSDKIIVQKTDTISKVTRKVRRYYFRVYYKLRRGFYNMFFVMNMRLPKIFRNEYIHDVYNVRTKNYKPSGKYNGEVVLFKATPIVIHDDTWGWGQYCDKVSVVTLAGDHATVFKEPVSIDILKNTFKEYMDKA